MKHKVISGLAVFLALIILGIYPLADARHATSFADGVESVARVQVLEAYGNLPLYFISNQGQIDAQVEYYIKTSGQTIYLTRDGIVFDLFRRGSTGEQNLSFPHNIKELPDIAANERLVFSLGFVGANRYLTVEGTEQTEAVVSYFIGNNPQNWL